MLFFCYFCIAMEHEITLAVEALRRGATLLYPTDTIWGLGCDARNAEAIEEVYALKGRDRSKSMLILCTAEVVDATWDTAAFRNRPTTYILPSSLWRKALRVNVADNLVASDGSLGIRLVNHPFCSEVIRRFGAPLVSTSANLSGHPSPASYDDISDELKCRVGHVVTPLPEFLSHESRGSRIVKIDEGGALTVIRP